MNSYYVLLELWVCMGLGGFISWRAEAHFKKYKLSLKSWFWLFIAMIFAGAIGWVISLRSIKDYITPNV